MKVDKRYRKPTVKQARSGVTFRSLLAAEGRLPSPPSSAAADSARKKKMCIDFAVAI